MTKRVTRMSMVGACTQEAATLQGLAQVVPPQSNQSGANTNQF